MGFNMARILRLPSFALLLASLFFTQGASAVEYYWYFPNMPSLGQFSSPDAGCAARTAQLPSSSTFTGLTFTSATQGNCNYRSATGVLDSPVIKRGGTECILPKIWDPVTHTCAVPPPDPCEATVNQFRSHQHRIGDFTGAGVVGGSTSPPGAICDGSCQFAWDGASPTSAYRFKDNNPNGVFGSYTYKGNGVSCSGSEPNLASPGANQPTKTKNEECTNKVEDAEGRISYSCTASTTFSDPGEMNCGSVNGGAYTCTPRANSPKLDDKKVKKDVSDKTNSDGSKQNTTTTTTTTTTCVGANACTSTTTTNTQTSGTAADGSSTGSSSSCTGPGCEGDAEDGSDTPEEETECDPATDPDQCGQTSATDTGSCDAAPACSGDPIPCAVLRQEWQSMCAGDELTASSLGTGLQAEGMVDADTLDDVLGKDADDISGDVSSIVSGVYSSGPSNTCPVQDVSISTRWGVINFPFSVNCPIFNVISAVIFFLSYLAAGWILFDALVRGK